MHIRLRDVKGLKGERGAIPVPDKANNIGCGAARLLWDSESSLI